MLEAITVLGAQSISLGLWKSLFNGTILPVRNVGTSLVFVVDILQFTGAKDHCIQQVDLRDSVVVPSFGRPILHVAMVLRSCSQSTIGSTPGSLDAD